VASFTGKDVRTIRRWVAKANGKVSQVPHDKMSQGVAHDYTVDEVHVILESGSMSKDAVSVLMENARGKNGVSTKNSAIDYAAIGKMIGMAVSAALTPIVDRLDKMSNQKALPEPVKEDFYSLVGYCALNKITVNRSELATHGRELKKMSRYKNLEVRKIPDERWGQVNSYQVAILDEYFAP